MESNIILEGDCLERLKELPDCCVDSIITDPPYGLSFMGKKWDYDVPSVEVWKECLRVLRPGGTALIFAGSRTQHRMAVNVEDAGFILKDCIMWLYGSGFPKATDISKQLDKGHERKVVGKERSGKTSKGFNDYKYRIEQGICSTSGEYNITEPATPEAKLWNGWKSHGLKPAYEPILVAMKPNEGSYANNALKYGVSGLNIEECRVGSEQISTHGCGDKYAGLKGKENEGVGEYQNHQGRYPANIILDEEAGKLLDEQSGITSQGHFNSKVKMKGHTLYEGGFKDFEQQDRVLNDKGGASRFFYCAKASKSERNLGCEELIEKNNDVHDNPNRMFQAETGVEMDKSTRKPNKNNHPTVKPLKLMEYLCKLTKTPTGGIVLDPYSGSGTTAIACLRTGRKYILIEKESEYILIAKARINHFSKQNRLEDYNE